MRPDERVAVLVGGAVGTGLRVLVTELVPGSGPWPWATLVVNVSGAFLLAWLVAQVGPRSRRLPLLGTGLLGSYTTFSAFAAETRTMVASDRLDLAVTYVLVSIVLGVVVVEAGRRRGASS